MFKAFIKKHRIMFVLSLLILLVLVTGCKREEGNNEIEPTKVNSNEIDFVMPTAMPREKPYYSSIIMNKKMRAPLYDAKLEESRYAKKVERNVELGMQFYAVTNFRALRVHCPSFGNNVGTIVLKIYKWDLTYAKTIAGNVLYTKEFVGFTDNAWLDLIVENLPEEEYLLCIENTDEEVGIWAYKEPIFGIRLYEAGMEMTGSLEIEIDYANTPDVTRAELSPNIWVPEGSGKTPDEIVVDKNHPINILNVKPDTWTAIDGLNRTLPGYEQVGAKKDKYVGMFYWTWHNTEPTNEIPRDLTKIIREHPEAKNDYNHFVWNEVPNPIYYWEEPIYGYYLGNDEYVYRKHAELLADAGVDVVFFDTTNGALLWITQYEALCDAWLKARQDGINTPKISFLTNFHNSETNRKCNVTQLEVLYKVLYSAKKYQDLWFYWEDKPLLMSRYDDLDLENPLHKEIRNFFTFRPGNPSYYTEPEAQDNWGWLSVYPQTKYGVDKNGNVEQMCVGVSQNANDDGLTAMNGVGIYGRSYTKGNFSYTYKYKGKNIVVNKDIEDSMMYGLNFQQQWDYAFANNPKFIWVTGWNERRCDRSEQWGGVENGFSDQFNDEFSRDIEPTTGVLKDHYYYQLVSNIRKFKGVEKPDSVNAKKTISLKKGIEQWKEVMPEFNHYKGNTPDRDISGVNIDIKYENHTMRNDIIQSKVAYDDKNIYFLVKTVDNITPSTDAAWMRLFIDTEESDSNWESFEYVINRVNPTTDKCIVERSTGDWEWEKVGEVEYSVTDNYMQIAIPRDMIGKEMGNVPEFNFKWADNTQNDGDIMDFYLNGDVAPGGRFKFAFRAEQKETRILGVIIGVGIGAIIVIVGVLIVFKRKK